MLFETPQFQQSMVINMTECFPASIQCTFTKVSFFPKFENLRTNRFLESNSNAINKQVFKSQESHALIVYPGYE